MERVGRLAAASFRKWGAHTLQRAREVLRPPFLDPKARFKQKKARNKHEQKTIRLRGIPSRLYRLCHYRAADSEGGHPARGGNVRL